MTQYATATLGGALIGLSAAMFLILNGRIAGISGIVAGVLQKPSERWLSNLAFVAGLLAGPAVFVSVSGAWPAAHPVASLPVLVIAGLFVGFGTRLGSGCTSGHGVCGLARLSPRSLAAVVTFLIAGVTTVLIERAIQ